MSEEKKVAIEVVQDFRFAHRGCDVVDYRKGETVEVSERCAEVALEEKWAKPVGKAKKVATENKDADSAPENKATE